MFKYANVWLMSASPFHDFRERKAGPDSTWEMQMPDHSRHEVEENSPHFDGLGYQPTAF